MKKEELINSIRSKWRIINNQIDTKYGAFYPEDKDKEGWRLLGRREGLALAISIVEDNL